MLLNQSVAFAYQLVCVMMAGIKGGCITVLGGVFLILILILATF